MTASAPGRTDERRPARRRSAPRLEDQQAGPISPPIASLTRRAIGAAAGAAAPGSDR